MENKTASLYVHVPFCRSKCPYCAFYSFHPKQEEVGRWASCAVKEFQRIKASLGNEILLKSVYFGGGTPSYLPLFVWQKLLEALAAVPKTGDCEFTVEANPDSVDVEKLALWKEYGVNRISLGVQSLNDYELKVLARPHTAQQALQAVSLCLEQGFRVSADLMFALPEQTLRIWHNSMKQLLATGLTHVSLYQLSLEPESFWGRRPPQNVPDGYAFYRWAQYYLTSCGLKQYEIASFARQGHQSRHNMAYWRRENVYAVGPGAWGFLDGVRFAYAKDLESWSQGVENDVSAVEYSEHLQSDKAASEAAVLALRMSEGIKFVEFGTRYGEFYLSLIVKRLRDLPPEYFVWTTESVALSSRGMRVGNAIWCELLDLEG